MKKKHLKTPIFTALHKYALSDTTAFDVPGHKMGKSKNILKDVIGDLTFKMDVNSMKELDLLSDPKGIIKEAQDLYADAYSCDESFLLVNGTSVGVQAMIMSCCNPFDKIILPRNVHKSVINALIMSGAIPIFIEPEIDVNLGIANGVSLKNVKDTIEQNLDAKAIFIINPTYFGICSDLKAIINYAHKHNVKVLVDEAHGAHFPFHEEFPKSAMELGADMSAVSIHKTGGSMSQSSVLLMNKKMVDFNRVKSILNMLQSTSASYLLMASLDVARRNLVIDGNALFQELLNIVIDAKKRINNINGFSVMTDEYLNGDTRFSLDQMKIVIQVNELGFSGFEIYDMLAKEYKIQLELAEAHVTMAVISVGDSKESLDKLVDALMDISNNHYGTKEAVHVKSLLMHNPILKVSPRQAFYGQSHDMNINDAIGQISANSIMIYPPGIPLLIPGEVISEEIIEHYHYYVEQG
ncbi:hypothetical protein GJ496_010325, partial [Pomphorhynchus laevis]